MQKLKAYDMIIKTFHINILLLKFEEIGKMTKIDRRGLGFRSPLCDAASAIPTAPNDYGSAGKAVCKIRNHWAQLDTQVIVK